MKPPRIPLAALLATWLAAVQPPPVTAAQLESVPVPAGTGSLAPRLANLGHSGAVLTWLERRGGGHRLLHATWNGEAFGPARTIAEGDYFFANWADTPGLLASPVGAWFAHWLQRSGQGTYAYDVRVSVSTDQGASWSPSFTPHRDGTPTEHGFVNWVAAEDGTAGLAWLDGRETQPADADRPEGHDQHGAGAMTLRWARLTRDGEWAEEALLDPRVCDCCPTDAAHTEEGPVVVYRDRSEDEVRDIRLVRRGPQGWSDPVVVHDDGWRIEGCPVNGPAVIARGPDLVVAWFTLGRDGSPRVRVARSTDAGRSFGPPVTLDEGEAIGRVDLAWIEDGFLLSWLSQGEGGRLRLARFESGGRLADTHHLESLSGVRDNGFPRLLTLANGDILIAWTRTGDDPGLTRVQVGRVRLDDR